MIVLGETVCDLAEAARRRYEEHRTKDSLKWTNYLRWSEVLQADPLQELLLIDGGVKSDGLFERMEGTLKMEDNKSPRDLKMEDIKKPRDLKVEDIKRPRDSRTTEDIKMVGEARKIPRDIMKVIETLEEAVDIKNMTDTKMVGEKITGMTMVVVVAVAGETTCRDEN